MFANIYIYKYSSEIDHLFDSLNLLNSSKSADIISIGCGPCTDLAGIATYVERKSVRKVVNYVGFDMTNVWDEIHVNLKATAQDLPYIDNFKIINADIFVTIQQIN